jgi:hypothetical protein
LDSFQTQAALDEAKKTINDITASIDPNKQANSVKSFTE